MSLATGRVLGERRNDMGVCAERRLMRDVPDPGERCMMVVLRIYTSKGGRQCVKGSQPCGKCAEALRALGPDSRVARVAWSTPDGGLDSCVPACVPVSAYRAKNVVL